MKVDYLTLKDGRKVRVEWNMNSMKDFTDHTGKELSDLGGSKADLGLLRIIAWCSVKEGEAIDGREFELSEVELGRLMGVEQVVNFSQILTSQGDPSQKKSEAPKKWPQILTRGRE